MGILAGALLQATWHMLASAHVPLPLLVPPLFVLLLTCNSVTVIDQHLLS